MLCTYIFPPSTGNDLLNKFWKCFTQLICVSFWTQRSPDVYKNHEKVGSKISWHCPFNRVLLLQGEQHHDLLHCAAPQQEEAIPLQHPERQEQPHDGRSASVWQPHYDGRSAIVWQPHDGRSAIVWQPHDGRSAIVWRHCVRVEKIRIRYGSDFPNAYPDPTLEYSWKYRLNILWYNQKTVPSVQN